MMCVRDFGNILPLLPHEVNLMFHSFTLPQPLIHTQLPAVAVLDEGIIFSTAESDFVLRQFTGGHSIFIVRFRHPLRGPQHSPLSFYFAFYI